MSGVFFCPFLVKSTALAYDFLSKSFSAVNSSLFGLWPPLYSYRGQFLTGHNLTSLNCPLLQSRHFARIALMGVNFAMFPPFPARCMPHISNITLVIVSFPASTPKNRPPDHPSRSHKSHFLYLCYCVNPVFFDTFYTYARHF